MSARAAFVTLLLVFSMSLALPLADAQTPSSAVVNIPSGSGAGPQSAPGFNPENITVVIGVNNTVVWTNNDSVDHTVFSVSVPVGATAFQSPIFPAGSNYTYTFTVAGTYDYHCSLHAWMVGSVKVLSSTKPVPEFPTASVAAVLLVAVAATALAAARIGPRSKPSRSSTSLIKDRDVQSPV